MYRHLKIIGLVLLGSACSETAVDDSRPGVTGVASTREAGVVPRPPGHAGRDVGFSGVLQGRSVWIFGDTFLPAKGDDGLRWRSSSWSWTSDLASEDGIGSFRHALGPDGMALQLLPHTEEEAAYNLAHEGHDDCSAKTQCGSRRTPWPQALVTDEEGRRAVVYYLNMHTGPGGQWDFKSVSGSVATWQNAEVPATRIEPPLFSDEEPDWGAAALRVGDDIYVYACEFDGTQKPCLLARVPFDSATERSAYRFWGGSGEWSRDWRAAVPIFEGGSLFSVHYNAHLGKYLAFYLPGIDSVFRLRTADQPQGPWSEAQEFGTAARSNEGWNYALIAHPEFSREGGRIEILSYTHPTGFLAQQTRLVEVELSAQQ